MTDQEFDKLIQKDKYQVFILLSRASFPLSFAVHPWIVINKKGEISRFDVRHEYNKSGSSKHLYVNAQPPFQGLPRIYPFKKFFSPVKLLKLVEGDENSTIPKIIDFIEKSKDTYPHRNEYSFIGPNCGTYVEWVVSHFPELKMKLPWTAIRKNFK